MNGRLVSVSRAEMGWWRVTRSMCQTCCFRVPSQSRSKWTLNLLLSLLFHSSPPLCQTTKRNTSHVVIPLLTHEPFQAITMASPQDSTLLSLPAELRNGIYEEVAYDVKNITIKIKDSTSDFVSAVLTTQLCWSVANSTPRPASSSKQPC